MSGAILGGLCPRCQAPFEVMARDIKIVSEDEDVARVRFDLDCCGGAVMPLPAEDLDGFICLGLPAPLDEEDVIEFQMQMHLGPYLAGVAEMEMSE